MVTRPEDDQFKYNELDRNQTRLAQSGLLDLYDKNSAIIRAVLRKILASHQEAEDLLESTFVLAAQRAKEGCAGWEGNASTLEPWLLLLARSQAVNRLRAARNESPLEGPELSGGDWRVQTQEIRLLESRRDLLRRLLEQLPAGQRRLLDLVLFEGQTEEEIARATNEPLGRVRDEVRAAFAFVRQRVQTVLGTWTAGL